MKKKVIIFIVTFIICFFVYLFKDYISNAYYYIKLTNINPDVTIRIEGGKLSNKFYLLDAKKKKLYDVGITECELSCNDLYFWQPEEKYSVKTKRLSSQEVDIILNVTKIEPDFNRNTAIGYDFYNSEGIYYYMVSKLDSDDIYIYRNDNVNIQDFKKIFDM